MPRCSAHIYMFQSTPPYGGRQVVHTARRRDTQVSIHAPVWGATGPTACAITPVVFQSTPPYGGRLFFNVATSTPFLFQSTPPYGGRLVVICHSVEVAGVSIHAPVWGATRDGEVVELVENVSIHAPVWGATRRQRGCHRRRTVSIHAPVWGATSSIVHN